MHKSLQNFNLVRNKVSKIIEQKQLKTNPKIIVVSKTFSLNKIIPFIDDGHIHFGENKVQEAENKWNEIINANKSLKLHMIGKLQSNKAKKAVKLFDFIHSLDNANLASKIAKYEKELNKRVSLFIQVNLAEESHKSGISLKNLKNFYNFCVKELSLNIIGLMCLPPNDLDSDKYFKDLKKLSDQLNLKDLSMGMSADFEKAVANGSTYLRLGTSILGKRKLMD